MNAPLSKANRTVSPRRRRLWLWLLLLVVAPLAMIAASLGMTRWLGSSHLKAAIARTDRLDPRWRLDELEADRQPFPPAGKNGMDQLVAIHAALPATRFGLWSFPQYESDPFKLGEARKAMDQSLDGNRKLPCLLSDEEARVLRIELTRFAGALALSRELMHFPYGRFPVVYTKNLYTMPFVHSHFARPVANILRYDILLRAHDGDMAGAMADIKAMVHANRAQGDEPILASVYSRISVDLLAVGRLERVLGLGEATDKDLQEIQVCLLEQAQVPYYLMGVRGERAGCDRLLESVQNGEARINEFAPFFSFTKSSWLETLMLSYTSISLKEQRAQMMSLLTDAVEIGKLPTEKQKDAYNAWEVGSRKNMQIWNLSHWMLPALGKALEWDLRTKATLRTAAVGIAAERYRLAHGRWPGRLEELVPQFLSELPTDPYDGKTLRWKQADGTFLIYSVGLDCIDNGGDLESQQPNQQLGSDIGFLLFDPAKRRQPARPFAFKTENP